MPELAPRVRAAAARVLPELAPRVRAAHQPRVPVAAATAAEGIAGTASGDSMMTVRSVCSTRIWSWVRAMTYGRELRR